MPAAIAILIGAQLVGELLRQALRVPLPGPVIGMFLLAIALMARGAGRETVALPESRPLVATANGLIGNMGLLFVPAGVGIVGQLGVLRQEWLPIVAGLLASTVLSLVVTALVMHHVSGRIESRPGRASPATGEMETR